MVDYQHPLEKNASFSNLIQLARYRAEEQNQQTACTFISYDEQQQYHLTYRQLDQKAKAIAALLQDADLAAERAL